MNQVRNRTSLHEKTVQQVAENAADMEKLRRRKPRSARGRASRVKKSKWSDGVDERIVAEVEKLVKKQGIAYSRIEKVSATEVIIKN